MSFLDIILGILLFFALIRGIRNGLFVELASLLSFLIGIYVAMKFSYIVGNMLGDGVTSPSKMAKIIAFVLTLILVMVAIHFLAKVFSKIASFVFLGWLNKLGGAVFAFLKTTLFLGIVLSLLQKINFDNALIAKETQEKSWLFNSIVKTSTVLMPLLTVWFEDLKKETTSTP
jgi:membrane protein required for colicin V production